MVLLLVVLFRWEIYWIITHIHRVYVLVPVLMIVAFVGIICRNKGINDLLVLIGKAIEGIISNLLKGNYVELVSECEQFKDGIISWWKQQ